MAEKLSIEQFAAEIKKRRPDLANIPNLTLVGKTIGAAPELKEFVNLDQPLPEAPGAFGSLFSHLGVRKDDPAAPSFSQTAFGNPVMDVSKPSVVSEGAAQSLVGMGHAVKGTPGGLWEGLKAGATGNYSKLAIALADQAKDIVGPMVSMPEPGSPDWQKAQRGAGAALVAAETPNLMGGAAIGGSKLAQALADYLPSQTRAGGVLNTIRAAAATEPFDTTAGALDARASIRRALELKNTGGGQLSQGMNRFNFRETPIKGNFMGAKIQMTPDPILYPESFDFASSAKRIASTERQAMGPAMRAQQNQFAKALQSGNREIAQRIGMGNEFDAAMKEYRRAAILKSSTDILADALKNRAVQSAIGTGVGMGAYRALSKQ